MAENGKRREPFPGRRMTVSKRTWLAVSCAVLIAAAGLMFWLTGFPQLETDLGPPGLQPPFVGARACRECHLRKFESFRHTAHHLTSQLATTDAILGDFTPGKNRLETRNPKLHFDMEARDGGFFQTAVEKRFAFDRTRSERIQIVTGSGKLGQTYLFWNGNGLFQLPVSYMADAGGWQNSPGYMDGQLRFDRKISPRCLECHATYFQSKDPEDNSSNRFFRDNFVLGISCERCHGPGREHVAYHRDHPDSPAQHIVNPEKLDRDRQIDLCKQCHSSAGEPIQPSFAYRPGRRLDDYVNLDPLDEQNEIGVHSNNQIARLTLSNCFQQSESMTCVTCHNLHVMERGDLPLFSRRCQKCHEAKSCGLHAELGDRITKNCVDCHLPKLEDKKTKFFTKDGVQTTQIRDHYITIYDEATRAYLDAIEE